MDSICANIVKLNWNGLNCFLNFHFQTNMDTRSKSQNLARVGSHSVTIRSDAGGSQFHAPESVPDIDVIVSDDEFQDSFVEQPVDQPAEVVEPGVSKGKSVKAKSSKSDVRSRKESLLLELKELEEREELLKLEARVKAAKSRVASLSCDSDTFRQDNTSQAKHQSHSDINLQSLQQSNHQAVAESNISKVLNNIWSSDSEGEPLIELDKGKRHKVSKCKSGIDAKPSDRIKEPLLWPHCLLQYEYVAKEVKFHDLSLPLLIAGELEIIGSGLIPDSEVSARIKFLKMLVYYAHDKVSFFALRDWYAAFLRAIELGRATWGDDPLVYGEPILRKARMVSYNRSGQAPAVSPLEGETYFCLDYQFSKCSLSTPHHAHVKGADRSVFHICAKCWRKERVRRFHPDTSPACPHNA